MSTANSINILNQAGITKHIQPPERNSRIYNCWSFVAFTLGWTDEVNWLHAEEMEYLLNKHSIVIDEPKVGAIAVFRCHLNIQLQHTALVISDDGEDMIHKPGGNILSNITKTEISTPRWTKWYNQLVEYRRALYI